MINNLKNTIKTSALLSFSLLFIIACGGGGGGGETGNTLQVSNPIPDQTAKVGVNFSYTIADNTNTCTDSAGNTITYTLSISNDLGLSANGVTISGVPNAAGTVVVTVRCSSTGGSAEDSFNIVVSESNKDPSVSISAASRVKGGEQVTLTGTATDTDGSIVGYKWTQTGGTPAVTLNNDNAATATFTAPAVSSATTFTFQLEVTDDKGATATATVTIEVIPENSPDVNVHFPVTYGIYAGNDIDVAGKVSLYNGATLSSVEIITDAGTVSATIAADGVSWRANNVSVPAIDQYKIIVKATDSNGLTNFAEITLSRSGQVGSGDEIDNDIKGTALDMSSNTLYVQTGGTYVSDIKTYTINLTDGSRSILNITDSGSAINNHNENNPTTIALDKANSRILQLVPTAVLAIDLSTLKRTVLSSAEVGSGVDFQKLLDITIDAANKLAYVADNTGNNILSVALDSGDRAVVADSSSAPDPIEAPLSLIHDGVNNRLIVAKNYITPGQLQVVDLSSATPHATSYLSGSNINGGVHAMAINTADNEVYYLDSDNHLKKVNLDSGNTESIVEKLISVDRPLITISERYGVEYDTDKKVIYVAGENIDNTIENIVFMIDPVSGDKVKIGQ